MTFLEDRTCLYYIMFISIIIQFHHLIKLIFQPSGILAIILNREIKVRLMIKRIKPRGKGLTVFSQRCVKMLEFFENEFCNLYNYIFVVSHLFTDKDLVKELNQVDSRREVASKYIYHTNGNHVIIM